MPESAVAEGVGQIQCLYLAVDLQANIDEVAADVRNQGPTILLVCCECQEIANQMERALQKEPVKNDLRGDGGKGKGTAPRLEVDKLQVQYLCWRMRGLILAGRKGIVTNCILESTVHVPGQHPLVMAEFRFSVCVQQMMSLKVALLDMDDQIERHGFEAFTWDEVAKALQTNVVRVVAGEFGDNLVTLLDALRSRITVDECVVEPFTHEDNGSSYLASSAMIITGPVGRFNLIPTRGSGAWPKRTRNRIDGLLPIDNESTWEELRQEFAPHHTKRFIGSGRNESLGWPTIQEVKQKKMGKVLPHTTKMSVFLGSRSSHRTPKAQEARFLAAAARIAQGKEGKGKGRSSFGK